MNLTEIKKISKVDINFMHFLPFLPSRERKRNFVIERNYGKYKFKLEAFETWNAFDLFVFLFILHKYQQQQRAAKEEKIVTEKIVNKIRKREETILTIVEINLAEICTYKRIKNQPKSRKNIADSIKRLTGARYILCDLETKREEIMLTAIKAEFTEKYKTATVYFNREFLDACLKHGIAIEFTHLANYKEKHTLVILDIILNTHKKNKNLYKPSYSREFLANRLGLQNLNRRRQVIKINKYFKELHKYDTKFPVYKYDRVSDRFLQVQFRKNLDYTDECQNYTDECQN